MEWVGGAFGFDADTAGGAGAEGVTLHSLEVSFGRYPKSNTMRWLGRECQR
jgi:hypothetical protein